VRRRGRERNLGAGERLPLVGLHRRVEHALVLETILRNQFRP
jgi:hypothetical protein